MLEALAYPVGNLLLQPPPGQTLMMFFGRGFRNCSLVFDKASTLSHKLLVNKWNIIPLSWSSCAKICRTCGLSNMESDWWALACTNSMTLSSQMAKETSSATLQILLQRTESTYFENRSPNDSPKKHAAGECSRWRRLNDFQPKQRRRRNVRPAELRIAVEESCWHWRDICFRLEASERKTLLSRQVLGMHTACDTQFQGLEKTSSKYLQAWPDVQGPPRAWRWSSSAPVTSNPKSKNDT